MRRKNIVKRTVQYLFCCLDESVFQHIFKEQITDLILIINEEHDEIQTMDYILNVYVRILSFFKNLKQLSVIQPVTGECPCLSLRDLPSDNFSSSTLVKLCISVYDFEDCISLLDDRLKQLSILIVNIDFMEDPSLMVHKSVSLYNTS